MNPKGFPGDAFDSVTVNGSFRPFLGDGQTQS